MKSTLLLGFLISVGVPGQESDLDDFTDEYTKNQKQLIDKYIKNKKAVVKVKVYKGIDGSGNPTGIQDEEHLFEIVSDGEQIRLFTKESTDPKLRGSYWFKTRDSSFFLSKGSLGDWQVSQVTFPTKGVMAVRKVGSPISFAVQSEPKITISIFSHGSIRPKGIPISQWFNPSFYRLGKS